MSKTDNTQPGWLREFRDGSVRHDHTDGGCAEQTLADVTSRAGRSRFHPRSSCRRYTSVVVPCPGSTPEQVLCPQARTNLLYWLDFARYDRDDQTLRVLRKHFLAGGAPYYCSALHYRLDYDPAVACAGCDNREDRKPCERVLPRYLHRQAWRSGPPAGWRALQHGKDRSRERDLLRSAVRDHRDGIDGDGEADESAFPVRTGGCSYGCCW